MFERGDIVYTVNIVAYNGSRRVEGPFVVTAMYPEGSGVVVKQKLRSTRETYDFDHIGRITDPDQCFKVKKEALQYCRTQNKKPWRF